MIITVKLFHAETVQLIQFWQWYLGADADAGADAEVGADSETGADADADVYAGEISKYLDYLPLMSVMCCELCLQTTLCFCDLEYVNRFPGVACYQIA